MTGTKMTKKTVLKGFTLIELMVVLAIVGLLAGFAISQYRDYAVRSKVEDGLALATPAKQAVATALAAHGADFTAAQTGYVFGAATVGAVTGISIVEKTATASPYIRISYAAGTGGVANPEIKLVPANDNGTISWTCTLVNLPVKYAPDNCH